MIKALPCQDLMLREKIKTSQYRYYSWVMAPKISMAFQKCELQLFLRTYDEYRTAPWVQMCLSSALSIDGLMVPHVVFPNISDRTRLGTKRQVKNVELKLERPWQLATSAPSH